MAKVTDDEALLKEAIEAAVPKPPLELVEYTIDLPAFTSNIRIDGREYQNGLTYKFKKEALDSIKDIVGSAWKHENEVSGRRKPYDATRAQRTYNVRG